MIAFVAYTIATWAQVRGGLKLWHVACLGIGLLSDATGTYLMYQLAGSDETATLAGALMAYVGPIALALMAIQLVLAVLVVRRRKQSELANFYKLSVTIWLIWLIPFIAGLVGH